jgi:hypothetical protein
VRFQPSALSYGEPGAEQSAGSTAESYATAIAPYVPLVESVVTSAVAGKDAVQQIEVYKAQIKNTQQLMRRQPWLRGVLQMRLRKLRARLRAAERRIQIQQESESSTRTYRVLGQTGAVVAIFIGVAVIIRLVRPKTAG